MSKAYSEIAKRVAQNAPNLADQVKLFIEKMPLTLAWIDAEWPTANQNIARPLLAASKQALLDAGATWAAGLNRGAVAALRSVIETGIAWIYYKDHPVEFKQVMQHRENMMLPKAVQNYAASVRDSTDKAYKELSKKSTRDADYYYSTVSSYVHGHPSFALVVNDLAEMTVSVPPAAGFLQMSGYSDEFISDVYLSYYIDSWGSVPKIVQENAVERVGKGLAKLL